MIIHYFLVEFGTSGDLYCVGCTGNKEKLLKYWQSQSRDVRYLNRQDTKDLEEERKVFAKVNERPYKPKKVKTGRKIEGIGTIISCKFYCDAFNSLPRSRFIPVVDERYKIIEPVRND